MPSAAGTATERIFVLSTGSTAHVAAASTVVFDLFNNDPAAVLRVLSLVHSVLIGAAVTGVGLTFGLCRTTSVGTGGSALSVSNMLDTDDTAPSTLVTARLKPTGGAAQGAVVHQWNRCTEETVAPVNVSIPEVLPMPWRTVGLTLRFGQGLAVLQQTNSSVGASSFTLTAIVE